MSMIVRPIGWTSDIGISISIAKELWELNNCPPICNVDKCSGFPICLAMELKTSADFPKHTDLRSLPKIELHLHLDCSLSYQAVATLAPSVTREEYQRDYIAPARCANLADFLSRAPMGFRLMQTEDSHV